MARQTFLMLGFGLALVVSTAVRADDVVISSRPRIYAQSNGEHAFKVLPASGEGVYFTFHEDGKENVIWRTKLVNIPRRAIITNNGKYVITIDTASVSLIDEHSLVVYGEKGKVIADFKLGDLLTAKEIESIPRTITMRGWHDKDIAEFEDRSFGYDELVIRMKHKGWTKVLRLTLSTGKLEKE